MLKEVDNVVLPNFDQKNKYDFAGRLKENDVGQTGEPTHPFKQTLGYDAFSNLTTRNTKTYSFSDRNFSTSYTNNRESGGANSYDAAGNLTYAAPSGDYKEWEFDAAGRQRKWKEPIPGATAVKYEVTDFDGDGKPVKRSTTETSSPPGTWTYWAIYSSVTGQKITDVCCQGERFQTNVYLGSTVIAVQYDNEKDFQVTDPVTGSTRAIYETGVPYTYSEFEDDKDPTLPSQSELARLGTAVPPAAPQNFPRRNYKRGGDVGDPGYGCVIDGLDLGPKACRGLLGESGAILATFYIQEYLKNEPYGPRVRVSFALFYDFGATQTSERETESATSVAVKQKKRRCKQSRTLEERDAVAKKLNEIAPAGSIGNIRDATRKNGGASEGIVFEIHDPSALKAALQAARMGPTIFNSKHTGQVGGTIFNTEDYRSHTVGASSLGTDDNSNGIVRSLQVVIGPPLGQGVVIGYADFDCSNPAQDVLSFFKHIFGR